MMSIHKLAAVTGMAVSMVAISACAQRGMMDSASMQEDSMMMQATPVMVGGAPMLPERTIVENAVNSEDHEILVAAVKQAGLVETLSSEGPFTVFAPTDTAFGKLPDDVVSALMEDENKAKLQTILTYHVVPGDITAEDLIRKIKQSGGEAELTTVSGGTLMATMNGPMNVVITDERGRTAHIVTYNVDQSNGVIHVVDTVLLPSA